MRFTGKLIVVFLGLVVLLSSACVGGWVRQMSRPISPSPGLFVGVQSLEGGVPASPYHRMLHAGETLRAEIVIRVSPGDRVTARFIERADQVRLSLWVPEGISVTGEATQNMRPVPSEKDNDLESRTIVKFDCDIPASARHPGKSVLAVIPLSFQAIGSKGGNISARVALLRNGKIIAKPVSSHLGQNDFLFGILPPRELNPNSAGSDS